MPTKEQVLHDIINENKKNIMKLMELYESTYTDSVVLWLKLNKKFVDNIIIMRADSENFKLL
jgi:hypothetical protein